MTARTLGALISIAVCLNGFNVPLHGQATNLDLRTDGRVISGLRKDFLIQRIRSHATSLTQGRAPDALALPVSARLRNKLLNSRVTAIVVPSGPLDGTYMVGLLIGEETLPEDWIVEAADFQRLREYSRSASLARAETYFRQYQAAISTGPARAAAAGADELLMRIHELSGEEPVNELYSGYLLAELANVPESPGFASLVHSYRAEAERALMPAVAAALIQWDLPSGEPVRISASEREVTVRDLAGSMATVSRAGSLLGGPLFLKVWVGRDLILVPESTGTPFEVQRYLGGVTEYVISHNPDLQASTIVGSVESNF